MKIGICISGQPRFFDIGFRSLQETFLLKYDCDVFIHSWYDEELIGEDFNTTHNGSKNIIGKLLKNSDKDLIKLYKPKKFIIDKSISFDVKHEFTDENLRNGVNVNNIYSMFYSMYKSYELCNEYSITNNITYDYIIRTRFDIIYPYVLDFSKLNPNIINIPYECGHPSVYCDIFAVSNNKNMLKYFNTYNNLVNLWSPNKHFIGENLLTDNLKNETVNKFNYPLKVIRND